MGRNGVENSQKWCRELKNNDVTLFACRALKSASAAHAGGLTRVLFVAAVVIFHASFSRPSAQRALIMYSSDDASGVSPASPCSR